MARLSAYLPTMPTLPTFADGGRFSRCKKYRYLFSYVWDKSRPLCLFILLNPTPLGENGNATVRRCINRAEALGYGGVEVANLYGLLCQTPKELFELEARDMNISGPGNMRHLKAAMERAGMIIAAWGNHGATGMDRKGIALAKRIGKPLHHLGLTDGGNPKHVLARGRNICIPYDVKPMKWEQAAF